MSSSEDRELAVRHAHAEELAALQSRLTEMEAREAVYREALDEIEDAARFLDRDDFDIDACAKLCAEALANPSPAAARLVDIEKAARAGHIQVCHNGTGVVYVTFGYVAHVDAFVEALRALTTTSESAGHSGKVQP